MLCRGPPEPMTSAKSSCWVCAEPLDEQDTAWCGQCGRPYHLNPRQDRPGKDCGQVWINEEHMALEFACNTCLEPASAAAGLGDVLDAAEAAAEAGVSTSELVAAAERGALRHRRTASGVYLFERGDLAGFQANR
jgi:hypothetical protein